MSIFTGIIIILVVIICLLFLWAMGKKYLDK